MESREKRELIFATANEHKLREVSQILDSGNIHLISLKDINWLDDIEETAVTLEGNALIKARTIFEATGNNVFADDTGLEVTALNMEPGVKTARYAGPQKDADDNMDKLLFNLQSKEDRTAQFRAVIALIWEGQEYLFEGIIKGTIATQKIGSDGFGYDPIFIPENYDATFAQLSDDIKNKISHRFRSIEAMRSFLDGQA